VEDFMNFNAWFTVLRLSAAMGLLVLPTAYVPSALAENNFSGAATGASDRYPDYSTQPPLHEQKDITLRDAALLALQRNPELAAFEKEKRALQGATLQAGLRPNPELSINVENIGNVQPLTGDINSPKSVTQEVVQQISTIRIYQLIELGGKRAARVAAASLGEELAAQDYEIRRVELIARVANVFIEVLAGQEQLRLAEESQHLAQRTVDTVAKRVLAGKVPPIEETRVAVALSTARIALVQAQRDLESARKRLALLWGNASPKFGRVLGNLESSVALPRFEELAELALASPAALRAMKNIEQRKALLDVEQTKRIPNLTIQAGAVHHAQLGGTTPIAAAILPLPLFDRNQGNILQAYQRVDKAVDEHSATELRLRTELTQAYEALSAAINEITLLRNEILPGATSAFEVTTRGYELGRFGFLEMLDTQRILFQNRVLYIRALANYQRLVNEIERLIAAPLDDGEPRLSRSPAGEDPRRDK
jgi:cobalt-zinc-cadmium efflux system outer membrane protein